MRCFRGGLTLGVRKIPFRVFSFVVGNDLQGIPNNWSAEQRERFDRTVNDLHTGAANLCSAYDKLVRAARKKLAP
jgi:hypothetical protein